MTNDVNDVVVDEEFDPLAGEFSEPNGPQIEWLDLSRDVGNGEYYFILGLGDPTTNRDKKQVMYAGNDAIKQERCLLFSSDGNFVANWLYTRCEDDPGFALGLDKQPSKFGGFWQFPNVSWTIPVLWNVSLNDEEEWDGESGTLVNLSMSEAQWRAIVTACSDGKKKNANKHCKVFKLVKNDKEKMAADYYKWNVFDDENVCDVSTHLGEEFTFNTMLVNERKNIIEKSYHGMGQEGAANVWAMLEEEIGMTKEQIVSNSLYNKTPDVVNEVAVNEVDLSLDT